MNIKEKIGRRIADIRKRAGLTIKELAQRTADIKPARIGNWEQGTRSPGPLEAKVLAEVLGVTASYLLCLSDDPQRVDSIQARVMPRCIPILTYEQALEPVGKIDELFTNKLESTDDFDRVPIGKNLISQMSDNAFALIVADDSMLPEFARGDVVIADPAAEARPGSYVIAKIHKQNQAIFRKFRQSTEGFDLIPLNSDWAITSVASEKNGSIVATIIEHRRIFR